MAVAAGVVDHEQVVGGAARRVPLLGRGGVDRHRLRRAPHRAAHRGAGHGVDVEVAAAARREVQGLVVGGQPRRLVAGRGAVEGQRGRRRPCPGHARARGDVEVLAVGRVDREEQLQRARRQRDVVLDRGRGRDPDLGRGAPLAEHRRRVGRRAGVVGRGAGVDCDLAGGRRDPRPTRPHDREQGD